MCPHQDNKSKVIKKYCNASISAPCRSFLQRYLPVFEKHETLNGVPLLVLAKKSDLREKLNVDEVIEGFGSEEGRAS